MSVKDLISIHDLTPIMIEEIFDSAEYLKQNPIQTVLNGKSIGLLFTKLSTRTRVSFQVGMYQLGGNAMFLSDREIQLKRGESIADTGRVLSRYLDGIVVRTYSHKDLLELATCSSIPVINGLTDLLHPCQVLSDMFTIKEKFGHLKDIKVVYLGDGANNMANSWIYGASKMGINLVISSPVEYQPDEVILKEGKSSSGLNPEYLAIENDPEKAVKDADVLYTDVWVSMGQEEESKERRRKLIPYQLNQSLLEKARKDAIVMHCLPAHRGEEISGEVIDGLQSVVLDQAENRLHVQKAILTNLIGK